jgi:uncharacterized SAM-binding protein YcdF (DUF218 family)
MPVDPPEDDADRTGEIPLVVPVSDAIGAVDLGPATDDDTDDTPTEETVTTEPGPTPPSTLPEATMSESGARGRTRAAVPVTEPLPTAPESAARDRARGVVPVTERLRATTPVAGVPVLELPAEVAGERPRRRWPRRLLLGIVVVVVVAGGYYAFNVWQVWSTGRSDQARPVDALVVMGAAQYDGRPSPQLEARLDHVLTLWNEGLASNVIVTGGNIPGDRFTEAEASAGYLVERGIPAAAILSENSGSNSYDSLAGVATLMAERGLADALIVTDPYHALRSRMTAEELGITAYVSPTPTSVVTGATELRRELGEAAGVAVGRIIGFDRLASLTG